MTSNGLWLSRCVGICTDGAKTMTGRHSRVVTRVRASRCFRRYLGTLQHPQEALAANGMPDSLKDVSDTTVKMVNFVKAKPMKSCVFSALCNDMGSEPCNTLQHTEARWLSRGKVLTFFF